MDSTIQIAGGPSLVDEPAHGPYTDALRRYLIERGHASHTVHAYLGCAGHFLRWTQRDRLDLNDVDEATAARFVDDHLPRCTCGWSTRTDRRDAASAIGHLLLVLRTLGVAAARPVGATPVDEELRRFDEHMDHVRGLAPRTRRAMLRIVRELLWRRFGDRPVVVSAIKPEHVRCCFLRLTERCHSPLSMGAVVSALRGYFRFRATCGDTVYPLIGVLSYPANWQQASLPQTLADEEVERLVQSLDIPSPSTRRSAAIVRCAVDLGLRSGEIATLTLDDINWRDGTVTLRKTKSRREQVLPLPEVTGRALAAYLQHERPKSRHRGVFVRRMAPHDEPVGADLVRKTIRQAYQRAGLPYTRSHLLRHTMARRLLDGGSSLKEVADVLRHRSLNTTLVYAKLDSRNLRSVALPWPHGVSSVKAVAAVPRQRSRNKTRVRPKFDREILRSVAMPWPGRVS
jgi:site-specific recombinase XerD